MSISFARLIRYLVLKQLVTVKAIVYPAVTFLQLFRNNHCYVNQHGSVQMNPISTFRQRFCSVSDSCLALWPCLSLMDCGPVICSYTNILWTCSTWWHFPLLWHVETTYIMLTHIQAHGVLLGSQHVNTLWACKWILLWFSLPQMFGMKVVIECKCSTPTSATLKYRGLI